MEAQVHQSIRHSGLEPIGIISSVYRKRFGGLCRGCEAVSLGCQGRRVRGCVSPLVGHGCGFTTR